MRVCARMLVCVCVSVCSFVCGYRPCYFITSFNKYASIIFHTLRLASTSLQTPIIHPSRSNSTTHPHPPYLKTPPCPLPAPVLLPRGSVPPPLPSCPLPCGGRIPDGAETQLTSCGASISWEGRAQLPGNINGREGGETHTLYRVKPRDGRSLPRPVRAGLAPGLGPVAHGHPRDGRLSAPPGQHGHAVWRKHSLGRHGCF